MNIPNFEDVPFVDKNGLLTDAWKNILQQLFQELQNNVSNEGIMIPQQSAANIIILTTTESIGSIIYDSTNNVFKACFPNGTGGAIYKVINVT